MNVMHLITNILHLISFKEIRYIYSAFELAAEKEFLDTIPTNIIVITCYRNNCKQFYYCKEQVEILFTARQGFRFYIVLNYINIK